MTAHRQPTPQDHVPATPPSLEVELVEITDRLTSETAGTREHDELAALVRQCQTDLSGAPTAALPELIERLARQRLSTSNTPAKTPSESGRR